MIARIIFLLFALSSTLIAGFEDHLKEITDKSGNHNMENIDFIYLINLDQRPEKLEQSLSQLEPYGIFPYRFSAVNGWELPLDVINDIGYHFRPGVGNGKMATWYPPDGGGKPCHEKIHVPNRCYFCHCMAKGPIGILLSHLSILQDAYDSGYETVWIMEDDIEVLQNPHLISSMIKKLDNLVGRNKWDILFTDRDTKARDGKYTPCNSCAWRPFLEGNLERFSFRKDTQSGFIKIAARYGTYSYVIRRSGIEKILKFLKRRGLFLPCDMEYILPIDIKLYSLTNDIVSTIPGAPSDNAAPKYQNRRQKSTK